jgi:Ni,Fe-hydrogenase I cytochrome b subunit
MKVVYNKLINQIITTNVKTILANQSMLGKKRLISKNIAAILITVLIIKFYLFFFHVLKQHLHNHLT